MIDGYIARVTKSESRQGALLDSLADIVFTVQRSYSVSSGRIDN